MAAKLPLTIFGDIGEFDRSKLVPKLSFLSLVSITNHIQKYIYEYIAYVKRIFSSLHLVYVLLNIFMEPCKSLKFLNFLFI